MNIKGEDFKRFYYDDGFWERSGNRMWTYRMILRVNNKENILYPDQVRDSDTVQLHGYVKDDAGENIMILEDFYKKWLCEKQINKIKAERAVQ